MTTAGPKASGGEPGFVGWAEVGAGPGVELAPALNLYDVTIGAVGVTSEIESAMGDGPRVRITQQTITELAIGFLRSCKETG